jgi:hypothetical protein
MADEQKPKTRPEPARTFPESDVWQPPGEGEEEDFKVDHPVYRKAKSISLGLGAIAGIAIAIGHPTAPWWMPIFSFAVVGVVAYRILRPRMRHPSIEDEI